MAVPLVRRPLMPGTTIEFIVDNHIFMEYLFESWQQKRLIGTFFLKPKPEDNAGAEQKDKSQQDQTTQQTTEEQQKKEKKAPSIDDMFEVGTLASVQRVWFADSTSMVVRATGIRPIKIIGETPKKILVKVADYQIQGVNEKSNIIKAFRMEIFATMKEIIRLGGNFFLDSNQANMLQVLDLNSNTAEVAHTAAAFSTAEPLVLQEILATPTLEEKLRKTLYYLKVDLEMIRIQTKISRQLEEKIAANQRKFYLNEQLKQIKKELGLEQDEKVTLVNKFLARLEGKKVPEHAKKVIDEEIAKLQTLEPTASEYNVTRNYLDWLTILPWGVYTEDDLDIAHAEKVLDEDHYGLKDLKERIVEFIAVGRLRGTVQGKILCLVGPPGVGKTSIGKSIARSLGREFYRFSVGGMSDVAEIKGHRRTYVGAMPGKLLQCLKLSKSSNPVVMIDEIDKMGRGHTGDPASAMLEVLDPEQNTSFLDHYLDVPYDLSKVLFICTANVLDTIPKPLLDRMEVLRLSGYVLEEKVQISKKYLIPHTRAETGLSPKNIIIRDGAIVELIKSYCREAGVRNLQKHIEKMFRKAAYKVAKGETGVISITRDNLVEFVGQPVYTSDRFYPRTPVGVTMGLAWTAMGGSTLYIETSVNKGSSGPSLRCTGQLGDVMKESTEIAYTFAKKFLSEKDPQNQFFATNSIHMHIPEGATPKDGPSAGITMVTSLISLATNKPVRHNLSMTGEITLTGKVLDIGGVKEKSIAAKRSGIKVIIFPKGNKKDWIELEEYIKKGLDAYFVHDYSQVYKIAFGEMSLDELDDPEIEHAKDGEPPAPAVMKKGKKGKKTSSSKKSKKDNESSDDKKKRRKHEDDTSAEEGTRRRRRSKEDKDKEAPAAEDRRRSKKKTDTDNGDNKDNKRSKKVITEEITDRDVSREQK
eukprot:GEZU01026428.1.p1 GENE.GEZU01026428.1~~GEZU01026428.1.p1  ORF type:complete len:924 (-),score=298.93 GEZU01026428.1:468-3239(-)